MCTMISLTQPPPPSPLTPGPLSPVGSTASSVSPRLYYPTPHLPMPLTPPHSERSFSASPGASSSPGPVSPPCRPPPAAQHRLSFSIDNILRPDFGRVPSLPRLLQAARASRPADDSTSGAAVDLRKEKQTKPLKQQPPTPADPQQLANPPLPEEDKMVWPAWVYCTRYSDRPSSGPRSRRTKKPKSSNEEKRPRTAFTSEQLDILRREFEENRYLTEKRRQDLAQRLGLNESQIKIWFQNKRAKIKKSTGQTPPLATRLMAQGLYNHATIAAEEEQEILNMCKNAASL